MQQSQDLNPGEVYVGSELLNTTLSCLTFEQETAWDREELIASWRKSKSTKLPCKHANGRFCEVFYIRDDLSRMCLSIYTDDYK